MKKERRRETENNKGENKGAGEIQYTNEK